MAPSQAVSFQKGFDGLTITDIVLTDDRGTPWPRPDRLLPLLEVMPGDLYSHHTIRNGIEYLYLTGLFTDIRVEGFRDAHGVRLAYTLVPIVTIQKVVITGNKAIKKKQLRRITSPYVEKELREDKLFDMRLDILALYHAEGFFEARLRFRREQTKDPYRVILHIEIQESEPTIIEEITFIGNTVFSDKELLGMMKSRVGKRLRRDVLLDRDVQAIAKKYAEAGYPSAKADVVSMSFWENKAYLTFSGNEGPKVTITFHGNEAFSSKKLKRNLLIFSERDVSDAVIESSAEKLESLYREQGYADATVTTRATEKPGQLLLDFVINEGKQLKVENIVITGNTVFSARTIKKQMRLKERPPWVTRWFMGLFTSWPFRRDVLDRDVENIMFMYRDIGYLDANIETDVTIDRTGIKATVTLAITEGQQTTVGIVSFEGNTVFTLAELLKRLNLKLGVPFSARQLRKDRFTILSAYSRKGYLYAKVDVETTPVNGSIDILYRITEGFPVSIGRIILRGNERTKDHVILRELLIRPGDPYNYGAMLRSQQKLYGFGYFGRIKFEPIRQGQKEYTKDILLTLEERPAGAVDFGVGYGNLDRFRGFFQVGHRNLWGRAHSARIRIEGSDILERILFNYREPWFLGYNLNSIFTLSWSDETRLNSDTRDIYYQTRKQLISFGVDRKFDNFKPSLTYRYEDNDNYNVNPDAILSPEDVGQVLISSLTPGLQYDLRDNPLNPLRGSLQGVALKEALKILGTEAEFTKLTLQSSWFFPAWEQVIALSARAGWAWPHRDTTEIPINERFFLGGATTVRGYLEDSVGPRGDDGTPTGGSSRVVFNAEFRINPVGGFGLVLFSDAGNVWEDQNIRMNDLRASFGAGIRLNTPVGPFRLDYGHKIHRRPDESAGELHFRLGQAF